MVGEIAIECRGITKSFFAGGTTVAALRGVDLSVTRGEMLMLVGPSGCGKTTLISVIAGILRADSGTCRVLDRSIADLSDEQLTTFRGKSVGFVFQSFNLIPTLTITENVAIPLVLGGEPRAQAIERAAEALNEVGLGSKLKMRSTELSGGQQQRVAIARAIVHRPEIVVCDEPTSALDGDTGHTVMELLRAVSAAHRQTMVIVTHDQRIFGFADRRARMNDGQIVAFEEGSR